MKHEAWRSAVVHSTETDERRSRAAMAMIDTCCQGASESCLSESGIIGVWPIEMMCGLQLATVPWLSSGTHSCSYFASCALAVLPSSLFSDSLKDKRLKPCAVFCQNQSVHSIVHHVPCLHLHSLPPLLTLGMMNIACTT